MVIDTKLVERTIGANMKLYRNALGMTAHELRERFAQVLNRRPVARQVIYMMEAGDRNFRAAELLAIAHILGVTVDDLFRAVEFKEPTKPERPKTPAERLAAAKEGRAVAFGKVSP